MSTTTASSAATSAAVIVVDLPAGYTPEAFEALEGYLVTVAVCTSAVFAILLYDYLCLARQELSVYRNTITRKHWYQPATWSFVLLRYAGIVASFTSLFYTAIPSSHCKAVDIITKSGGVLVMFTSGLIFGYRVAAMWAGNTLVYALIAFLNLVQTAAWCAAASQNVTVDAGTAAVGSNCQQQISPTWTPICWAASVAFSLAMLLLALARYSFYSPRQGRVMHIIYRDSLMYFIVAFSANLVVLVIEVQGDSFQYIKLAAAPFQILVIWAMGCRAYLNLRRANGRVEGEQTNTLPIMFTTITRSAVVHHSDGQLPAQYDPVKSTATVMNEDAPFYSIEPQKSFLE